MKGQEIYAEKGPVVWKAWIAEKDLLAKQKEEKTREQNES